MQTSIGMWELELSTYSNLLLKSVNAPIPKEDVLTKYTSRCNMDVDTAWEESATAAYHKA